MDVTEDNIDELKKKVEDAERKKLEERLLAFRAAIEVVCDVHKADIHSEPVFIRVGDGTFAVAAQLVYKLRKET
jgi:hypothetical protein